MEVSYDRREHLWSLELASIEDKERGWNIQDDHGYGQLFNGCRVVSCGRCWCLT